MSFFHNINTVARYEARTLRRSWFFRLFMLGSLFIFSIMNTGLFSPVGDESWDLVSIPSSVPLVNLYLLNIGQALVVIFLAADFLKRDKKVDTNEVLYTRPMSNLEYITGKTLGILRLFLGLDLVIMSIGLLMNIISPLMKVDWMSYLWYLLIIPVPTIIFSLGLAFLLMSVIRNQAVTFLVLLGMAALDMFWLWYRLGFMFDYMAFGYPLFKSAVAGFSNPGAIAAQRLLYFFLGLAFVMLTTLIFNRLPQSKLQTRITAFLFIIFFAGGSFFAYKSYLNGSLPLKMRTETLEINKKVENELFLTVDAERINFTHTGESIEAEASLVVRNENSLPLEKYIFSLNPGLNVSSVTYHGNSKEFRREGHLITVVPGESLIPGAADSLTITYHGVISESYCYPDFIEKPKEYPYRIAMLNLPKRQAFVDDDYVLLTPETHWYPVAGLNFYPSNPAALKVDFTRFSLSVKNEPGMSAVSQGERIEINEHEVFRPATPLTGLTLAIGDYITDTLIVDSVKYLNYHFRGNDYYKKDLSLIGDTLKSLVSGIMRDLETNFSSKYPFPTFSLVEVPVMYYSLPKKNTQTRAELQPSMVLIPEKLSTIQMAGFARQFNRQKKRMARNNQVITDKELQVRLFTNVVKNTFISGQDYRYVNGVAVNEPTRYRLGPSFYYFRNNFYSQEYPVINAAFESHLQKISARLMEGESFNWSGSLSENDRANLALRNKAFSALLSANPSGDTLTNVITVKGDWLFNLLRNEAGIEEFNKWFSDYLSANRFKRISLKQFSDDFRLSFGKDFYGYMDGWYNIKEQPGFLFNRALVTEFIADGRTRYKISFIASNSEKVPGVFNIAVRTGSSGAQGVQVGFSNRTGAFSVQDRGMEIPDISRIVMLAPGESKRINLFIDAPPRELVINTIFSNNIPGELTIPLNETTKGKLLPQQQIAEELLASGPEFNDRDEIIVDNEDQGFDSGTRAVASPLKRMLGIGNKNLNSYELVRMWNVPEYWQPVVKATYYGKYIRSAVYTRSGTGDRKVIWKIPVDKPGFYDVYTYIGKTGDNVTVRTDDNDGETQQDDTFREQHYTVTSDEGNEEITLDYTKAEGGWNMLGRYYISSDTAKVILTNKSEGRCVIADAVKWVRQK